MYGYFAKDELLGIISLREDNEISFLFVDRKVHRLGIASKLLKYVERIVAKRKNKSLTLDASIYGYEFYLKKGFIPLKKEQVYKGMRYIPMKKTVQVDC